MNGFDFHLLFGLSCLLLQCKGRVYPSSNGTTLTITSGSNARIVWTFDDAIQSYTRRYWSFTSRDGRLITFAYVIGDGDVIILSSLFDFGVEKPATLILKNVNETYNGTYKFALVPSNGVGEDEVIVFIAETPIITVNCSNVTTVIESDYFACECKRTDGNPPADVTWYKDNTKIVTGKESILRFPNVKKENSGTYRCAAKRGIVEAKNEAKILLIVNYPPESVHLMLTRNGPSATITCTVEAHPEPSFKVFLNETILVINDKTYTIPEVNRTHVGNYKCVAENGLGNASSDPEYLSLEPSTTTFPSISSQTTTKGNETGPSTQPTTNGDATDKACIDNTTFGTEWYIIVVTLVSGIIVGILVSYIASCSHRRWFKNRKSKRNPDQQPTEADSTYQGLDLSKMNQEDSYQSLRGNVARINDVTNDDDSTYTELSKTRDVENNYQSLT